MIFGETALADAEGALLAHSLKGEGFAFKKGRRLTASDVDRLRQAGYETVVAARLEAGDVHEDEAATRLASALLGPNMKASASFTGRCNLIARTKGLLIVDRDRLDAINLRHEAITVATLSPYEMAAAKQMVATIKIIPFAVPKPVLDDAVAMTADGPPVIAIAPLQARTVGLVQSELPGMKAAILDKTVEVLNRRLVELGAPQAIEKRCAHRPGDIAAAIKALREEGCDVVLVSGASAIVDRRDVVPTAIEAAGGEVDHFGMPVDPGNLLLLAHDAQGPVLGLPGCARSPKLNGFDWVLERLMAGLEVRPEDIMRMGAGGLLKEIGVRPLPRAEAVSEPRAQRAPRIAAVLLAAGLSRRMGRANKLLLKHNGVSLVRRAANAALESDCDSLIVVTGHEKDAVLAELAGIEYRGVHNANYETGLASSLKAGLSALEEDYDGAVILLGDMPELEAGTLDKLIAAFNPLEGRSFCVPVHHGKRGNPVLIAKRYFQEAMAVEGDRGARQLLQDYSDQVAEVPVEDAGVLRDIDTPEAAERLL